MLSQSKIFNHTMSKAQASLVEERALREQAERKTVHMSCAASVALLVLHTERVTRRAFSLWRMWLQGDRWTLHKGAVSPRKGGGSPPRGSPAARASVEAQLVVLRQEDAERQEEEQRRFELRFNQKTEKLLQKLEKVKVEMESKDAEIYREKLVSAALRHRLREANEAASQAASQAAASQADEDDYDEAEGVGHERERGGGGGGGDAHGPAVSDNDVVAASSPLAGEVGELTRQLAASKLTAAALRAENDALREASAGGSSGGGGGGGGGEAQAAGENGDATERVRQLEAALDAEREGARGAVAGVERQLREAETRVAALLNEAEARQQQHRPRSSSQRRPSTASAPAADVSTTSPAAPPLPPTSATRSAKSHVDRMERARRSSVSSRAPPSPGPSPQPSPQAPAAAAAAMASVGRRRSSSLGVDGRPKQVTQFAVGAAVAFRDLSGRSFDGWVTAHVQGRVEVRDVDGVKHTVLPGRVREREEVVASAASSSSTAAAAAAAAAPVVAPTPTEPVASAAGTPVVQPEPSPSEPTRRTERGGTVYGDSEDEARISGPPSVVSEDVVEEVVLIQMGPPAASEEAPAATPGKGKHRK